MDNNDIDAILDISMCNYPLPTLHTYIDPYFPVDSKILVFTFQENIRQKQSRQCNAYNLLRDLQLMGGDAWVVHHGGRSLSEERKELIAQLPPPLEIKDPPFASGVFFLVV